jgi:zinc protease
MTQLDRSISPVSHDFPTFTFPQFAENFLSNGIKVYVVEDTSQPLVSIALTIKCGSAFEPIDGLARFTARMFTRGTAFRSAEQIANEIDSLGASISSSAGSDATETSIICLAEFTDSATAVLADCFQSPIFDETEIERLRRQSLAQVQQLASDPNYLAATIFYREVFSGHPYSHRRHGTLESFGKITRNDCISWYEHLQNQERFFIVAGNITTQNAVELLERYFGSSNYTPQAPTIAPPLPNPKREIVAIDKPESLQTTLCIGYNTIEATHPDYPALTLANSIFGGMFSSRINELLREKHGFTYGARSSIDDRKFSATIMVTTSVGAEATAQSVRIILEEIERMKLTPISENEFQTAKQYLLGSFVRDLETPHDVSNLLQTIELYNFPKEYYTTYFNAIATLGYDELYTAQQRYFQTAEIVIAAAGIANDLKNQLVEFGDVKITTLDSEKNG